MEIHLVPLGNAAVDETTGEYQCQHGAEECKGNGYLACANELFRGLGKW